jgi:DNA-directed RNA polymerase specialized sigma24 family protein
MQTMYAEGGDVAAVDIRAAETFRALFEGHARAVLGYALRRTDDPADAADAVAETFLVVRRRLPLSGSRMDTRSSFAVSCRASTPSRISSPRCGW